MKGFSEKIKSELAKAESVSAAGGDNVGHGGDEAAIKKVWTVENLVTAPNSEFAQNQIAKEVAENSDVANQVEQKEQMIEDLIKSDDDLGVSESGAPIDDSSPADRNEDDEDLYSIKNFSL